jgi:hypothetical protein
MTWAPAVSIKARGAGTRIRPPDQVKTGRPGGISWHLLGFTPETAAPTVYRAACRAPGPQQLPKLANHPYTLPLPWAGPSRAAAWYVPAYGPLCGKIALGCSLRALSSDPRTSRLVTGYRRPARVMREATGDCGARVASVYNAGVPGGIRWYPVDADASPATRFVRDLGLGIAAFVGPEGGRGGTP